MPLSSFRSNRRRGKPVLMAVIDALASRVVLPALQRGELPNFGRMAKLGVLRAENSAVFPSITPAATASLVTGAYPQEHGVLGAYWYDRDRDEVAYFGDDFWVIVNKGLRRLCKTSLSSSTSDSSTRRRSSKPSLNEDVPRPV